MMHRARNYLKKTMMLLSFILIQLLSWTSYSNEPEFLPVTEAFPYKASISETIEGSESQRIVHIHWDISDYYYLYKSRIKVKQNGQALNIHFKQSPISKDDEYFGKVDIFKHALDIFIIVNDTSPVLLSFQGCAEAGLCYPPVKLALAPLDLPVSKQSHALLNTTYSIETDTSTTALKGADSNDISSITALLENGSLALQLLIFFVLGLGLAFTPCVFPMIPILSSIIVGQGTTLTTRKAFAMSLSYVLAMAVTYAVAGVVVGYFGATANISLYLQNPVVLGVFAIIFILLALSMFGLYELALPRFIQDKLSDVQQKQQGGSLISVAIMGALSALVVSPCVSAPLAGTLVYISTTGDALLGGLALFSLGLGMGGPLLIIGTGGGKLLPKAGLWMDAVKNVFGVALLAIAIWLLERVIPAPVTLILLGVLLIGSGTFLGAFEQGTQGWQRFFKALGIVFSIYGSLLMVGAAAGQSSPLTPLKLISSTNHNSNVANSNNAPQGAIHTRITKSEEFNALLLQANKNNKLLVLDFYADWCIACKAMETEVFRQPEVGRAMTNIEFVQMDMTDNTNDQLLFLKSFNLFGPPAVLIFKNKKEISDLRIVGDLSLQQFLDTIKIAKAP